MKPSTLWLSRVLSLVLSLALSIVLSATLPSSYADEAPPLPPLQVDTLNGVQIGWTEMGDPNGPPMLMVMGLGSSYKVWGRDFPAGLVDQGFRLIFFDNRDVGQSQRYDDWGDPVIWWNLLKAWLGLEVSHAYTLSDMGDDAIALLDKLEIDRAYVLGASMGGMIAQTIAIEHPERVIKLISIMSTTGASHLPEPSKESSDQLKEVAETPQESAADLHARGFYPEALPRQFMAILQSGDRSEKLMQLDVPTLVLHGEDDPLIPLEHGKHTAEMIPGARFYSFAGMAHNIPPEVRPALLARIEEFVFASSEGAAQNAVSAIPASVTPVVEAVSSAATP